MAVEERVIEVTVLSANDLKKVKKFGMEQKCYAEVYIYPSQKHQTKEDNYGGVNPNWNEKIKLTCFESHVHPPSNESAPSTSHAITVNIFCKSSSLFSHDPHLVGTVTVPLRDVGVKAAPNGIMKVYDVHREGEEIQGSLFLSVKLGPTRELAEYEDPSAPPLPHFSSHKVDAPTTLFKQDSKVKGRDTATTNNESHISTGSPHNNEKLFSTNAYATGVQVDNETVMGYPIYAFDPLNQVPAPDQHRATMPYDPLGQYYGQSHQQPFTVPGERPIYLEKHNGNCQMNPRRYNNCQRRCGRRCGHRRPCGPIGLVRMIVLGPVVMGLRQLHRHLEQK